MKTLLAFGLACVGACFLAAVAVAQLPPGFPGKKLPPGAEGGNNPAQALLAGAQGGELAPLVELAKTLGATDPQQAAADLQAAVRGVSLYPPRTRTAILTLAKYTGTYPKLLVELKAARAQPATEIDRYLTSNQFPEELQQSAAIVLIDAPETIDRMLERQPLVALVGKAYSTAPGKEVIETVLTVLHEQTAQTQSASTDAWAEQLSADPKLLEQYLQMLAAYAQQAGAQSGNAGSGTTGESGSSSYDPYGYGTTASSEGYSVSDVPSEEVINYALAYGYQYGDVASALINQYATQENLEDYQQAVAGWWDEYGQNIPQELYGQHQEYYDSLKQLSQFDKAAAAQGATTAAGRAEFLRKNGDRYPQVAQRVAGRKGPGSAKGPGGKGPGEKGPGRSGEGPFSKALNKGVGGQKGPAASPFTKGSASPFSDLSKATPKTERPPQKMNQAGPFSALAGGKGPGGKGPATKGPQTGGPGSQAGPFSALGGGKAPPMQAQRGQPAFGNQLARAQSFQGAAWSGPRPGGGGFPGGGFPGGGGPSPKGGPSFKGPGGGGPGPKGPGPK